MGAKKQNGMILDRGATDAYPLGASAAVRAGYLEFCRRHPGFDDSALTPERPLYGHKSGKQQKTHWVTFIKLNPTVEGRTAKGQEA